MSELLMHELAATDHLKFSGPLTVRAAKQIRARLTDALRQYPAVTIDCSGATEVDLSFIQLILSARKSASAAAKTLSLAQPADGALLEALRQRQGLGRSGRALARRQHELDEAEIDFGRAAAVDGHGRELLLVRDSEWR